MAAQSPCLSGPLGNLFIFIQLPVVPALKEDYVYGFQWIYIDVY